MYFTRLVIPQCHAAFLAVSHQTCHQGRRSICASTCRCILQQTISQYVNNMPHFQCCAEFHTASHLTRTTTSASRLSCRNLSQYVVKMRYLQRLKEDEEFCQKSLENANFAVYYGLQPLVHQEDGQRGYHIAWKDKTELQDKLNIDVGWHSLALLDCKNVDDIDIAPTANFAINIPSDSSSADQKDVEFVLNATAMSMRKVVFMTSKAQLQLISQGYAYLQWHSKHQFCPNCGHRTNQTLAGSKRICQQCQSSSFPMTSPVAITLVTNDNRCLVARQPQFPNGMYSALAGFCEPGESLEDAVKREVAEEVGLDIGNINYLASQHWPFPSSAIMLACYASIKPGTSDKLILDTNEIEDAKWLHRDEVKDIIGGKGQRSTNGIWLPPVQAIAHQLLKRWANL